MLRRGSNRSTHSRVCGGARGVSVKGPRVHLSFVQKANNVGASIRAGNTQSTVERRVA